jgi:hypothetical protein
MLDAHSATVIGGIGDGFIVHWSPECIGADEWAQAAAKWHADDQPYGQFDQYIEDLTGVSPLIRYSIHEYQGQNAYEYENSGDVPELNDLTDRRDALRKAIDRAYPSTDADTLGDIVAEIEQEIEDLIDVLSAVICDQCGERIE